MSSGTASAKASPSVSKQIVGAILFIFSLFFLMLALGIGVVGRQLTATARLVCFVGAIISILVGLLNFGVL